MSDLIPNAEPHEILYLIVGGLGMVLTFIVLCLRLNDAWNLYHTYDADGKRVNGDRRSLAWERVGACFLIFFINGFMVTSGLSAALTEPREWSAWRYLTVGSFFFIAVFGTVLALLQLTIRFHPNWKRWVIRRQSK